MMLALPLARPWPRNGDHYGKHADCGGSLVWAFVPPRDADPIGPGAVDCKRCGLTLYARTQDSIAEPTEADVLASLSAEIPDDDEDCYPTKGETP